MAVRSRAISSVPVTKRKMMKMLMILSRERSNQTIIWKEGREIETESGRSYYNERPNTTSDWTHGETFLLKL